MVRGLLYTHFNGKIGTAINTQRHFKSGQFPAGNPIANALVVIAGICVIGISIVLGLVAFIALGSVFLVLGGVVGIRLWWLNRKLKKQGDGGAASGGERPGRVRIDVIEGEYRDLSGKARDEDR